MTLFFSATYLKSTLMFSVIMEQRRVFDFFPNMYLQYKMATLLELVEDNLFSLNCQNWNPCEEWMVFTSSWFHCIQVLQLWWKI